MVEYRVKGAPGFSVHPGELWREILEEHLEMPVAEAARRMGVSRQSLYAVLRGASAVTADMALRFGRLVGADPALYLHMQAAHDLFAARARIEDALDAIKPAGTT
ncbi:MAG TPA: HigA family addiction module antitoxin [Stellaceae bacterium]|nr:HigA family addiction module antitoxin [Stellaceae bacterium]